MKTIIIYESARKIRVAIIVIAAGSLAVFSRAELPSTITTMDGQTYNGISLIRTEPDGYLVNYTPGKNGVGIAKIKFSRLSADQQKEAGYNASKAREFEASVAKATDDWRQENVRWEQAAKTERQSREARDFQEEQLTMQRIAAMAELQPASATPAGPPESGYGYDGAALGSGAVAIPEIGVNQNRRAFADEAFPLQRDFIGRGHLVRQSSIRPFQNLRPPINMPHPPVR